MGPSRRAVAAGLAAAAMSTAARGQPSGPIVIAHRGASGYRPEHTVSAYRLAIEQGADFIEQDLVVTRDGTLVCRHEPEIGETTDISSLPRFANHAVARIEGGREIPGWYAHDLLLPEFLSLRAKERLPQLRPGSARFDGQEPPATFQQAIELAKSEAARLGRPVGLYPELKAPAELAARGHDTGALLLDALNRAGLPRAEVPVFIQCFEPAALERLKNRTRAPLVQLTQTASMLTASGLARIATYANGVGVEKSLITPAMVAEAHRLGLFVHAWTFRAENRFLPEDLRRGTDPAAHGDLAAEVRRYAAMGVDGMFADFPDVARAAL